MKPVFYLPALLVALSLGACDKPTVVNVPASTAEGSRFDEFLEFETLTMCPIDTRCLDRRLLHDDEIIWLNAYHATVHERLAHRVSEAGLAWLNQRTAPI